MSAARTAVLGRAAAFAVVLSVVAAGSFPTAAQRAGGGPGPRFRADGPDADAYGRAEGYPS